MKNLFPLAFLMMTFTSVSFASDVTPYSSNNSSDNEEVVEATKYTVNGKNMGNTITTTIGSDGSSTTTVDIKCDNSVEGVCYTVEMSPSGFTEVDPTGVDPVIGILIDSDESNHWYKLQTNQ